jgi:hypothetical protein
VDTGEAVACEVRRIDAQERPSQAIRDVLRQLRLGRPGRADELDRLRAYLERILDFANDSLLHFFDQASGGFSYSSAFRDAVGVAGGIRAQTS